MIYTVKISDEAGVDLRGIYEYIAFDLLVPETAANQLKHLKKSILGLNEMPKRFPLYQKEPWLSRGMRFIPVDNFLVYYIPDDEKREVTVLRVLYSGRNIDEEFGA